MMLLLTTSDTRLLPGLIAYADPVLSALLHLTTVLRTCSFEITAAVTASGLRPISLDL